MDDSLQIPPIDLIALPLFPLNVVLFPGMELPLHIFEERYKAMIGDCLDRQTPFGVVLIQEGREVGEPAHPFAIGTTARIVQVERLEEGRMNIATRGERRFQTAEISQRLPHLVGQVRYLEEERGESPPEVIAEIAEEYGAYRRNLTALAGGWAAQSEVPRDPVDLSYGIAANLDLSRPVRQQLLELPTAGERLQRLLPLLKRGNKSLQRQVANRNPFRGPRLN